MLSLHLTSDFHGPSQSFTLSFQKNASPDQSVMRISLILLLSNALSLPSFDSDPGWQPFEMREAFTCRHGDLGPDISCQSHILIQPLSSYIYHKKSKRQTLRKGFALLKNDITNNLKLQKPVIYSRYQNMDNEKLICNKVTSFI
jgi:hypothetical protein